MCLIRRLTSPHCPPRTGYPSTPPPPRPKNEGQLTKETLHVCHLPPVWMKYRDIQMVLMMSFYLKLNQLLVTIVIKKQRVWNEKCLFVSSSEFTNYQ